MNKYEIDDNTNHNIIRLDREAFERLTDLKQRDPFEESGRVWDQWYELAVDIGLKEDMAQLGRGVMREFYQHDWQKFEDEVSAQAAVQMVGHALFDESYTRARWVYLLETDGEWRERTRQLPYIMFNR